MKRGVVFWALESSFVEEKGRDRLRQTDRERER